MPNIMNKQSKNETPQGREWQSHGMIGEWEGTGTWNRDTCWNGCGTWRGGLLSGNWHGTGKWKTLGASKGIWEGTGELRSNISFKRYALSVFIMKGFAAIASIGLASAVAGGLISDMPIISAALAAIFFLLLVSIMIGRWETANGKWMAKGVWEDYGDFRVLDISGTCRLGYHRAIVRGKMKDFKPR